MQKNPYLHYPNFTLKSAQKYSKKYSKAAFFCSFEFFALSFHNFSLPGPASHIFFGESGAL